MHAPDADTSVHVREGVPDEEARQHNALTAASLALHTLSLAVDWLAGLPQRCRYAPSNTDSVFSLGGKGCFWRGRLDWFGASGKASWHRWI